MTVQIQLSVMDPEGRTWIVPAELIESKFKAHQFAVHKSLSLSDDTWVVSHVGTGAMLAHAGMKSTAVEAALSQMKHVTAKRFEEIVKAAQLARENLALTKSAHVN